jgi:hypothetical protein
LDWFVDVAVVAVAVVAVVGDLGVYEALNEKRLGSCKIVACGFQKANCSHLCDSVAKATTKLGKMWLGKL